VHIVFDLRIFLLKNKTNVEENILMSVNIVIYSIIPSFVAYIAMKNNTAFDYLTIM